MKKLTILLAFTQMKSLGGVQTLIVRMSNWLVDNGHNVKLLLFHGGKALDLLDKRVEVLILGDKYDDYFKPSIMRRLSKKTFFSNIDFIYSFGAKVLFLSTLLLKYLKNNPKIACGIYYPMIFSSPNFYSFNRVFGLIFDKYLSHENKFFMSKEILNINQSFFKSDYSNSKVFPLPIDNLYYEDIKRSVKKHKIISVGRLVSFKTYNNYMIDVVEELINSGHYVTYDVYGDGPLKEKLIHKVKTKSLENYITFHGSINYDSLKDVFADAFVFVGMGTAVLEASFCKVPSIVAILEKEDPISQGYIYEMPEYNCGEFVIGMKQHKVYDLIVDLINKDDKSYLKESKKTYMSVNKYSINSVMNNFLDLIKSSENSNQIKQFPLFYFYLYNLRSSLKNFLLK